jgi:hypothetical protein
VIPSYDYSGDDGNKAPRLQGKINSIVIPDLDISRGGARRWAEVKTKSAATYTRITRRLEHGIPLRHWKDYQRVQEITGCEVWLYIYEEDTGQVLRAKIDYLANHTRIYDGNGMSWGGMAFWARDIFEQWMVIPINEDKKVNQ